MGEVPFLYRRSATLITEKCRFSTVEVPLCYAKYATYVSKWHTFMSQTCRLREAAPYRESFERNWVNTYLNMPEAPMHTAFQAR